MAQCVADCHETESINRNISTRQLEHSAFFFSHFKINLFQTTEATPQHFYKPLCSQLESKKSLAFFLIHVWSLGLLKTSEIEKKRASGIPNVQKDTARRLQTPKKPVSLTDKTTAHSSFWIDSVPEISQKSSLKFNNKSVLY